MRGACYEVSAIAPFLARIDLQNIVIKQLCGKERLGKLKWY